MSISIKETKDLDYDNAADIFYEVKFLKHPEKRKEYKTAIEKGFRNSQYVVSAWENKELVGFARVLTDEALFATIWNMLVKPAYQKSGVGKMLIQKCLDRYPKCYFFLFAGEKVVDFYRKMGFDVHQFGMYLKAQDRQSALLTNSLCLSYNE